MSTDRREAWRRIQEVMLPMLREHTWKGREAEYTRIRNKAATAVSAVGKQAAETISIPDQPLFFQWNTGLFVEARVWLPGVHLHGVLDDNDERDNKIPKRPARLVCPVCGRQPELELTPDAGIILTHSCDDVRVMKHGADIEDVVNRWNDYVRERIVGIAKRK